MKHALLIYDTAPNYLERRQQFRDAHLAKAWEAANRGEILLAGACAPPERMGVLLFHGEDPLSAAERFAKADPYVLNGLVERWRVAEWLTVVGEAASAPVKPS